MKKKLLVAAMLLGGMSLITHAQNKSDGAITTGSPISPLPVSNEIFRFKQGLVTHLLNGDLPYNNTGVGFTTNDRWLSFGEITGGSQVLQGFRTQRNGRGLSLGLQGTSATATPNSFIEWIGNSGSSVTPGNLDFRFGTSPTSASPVTIFTMEPDGTGSFADAYVLGNSTANGNGYLGHLAAGKYRGTTVNDNWIGIGQLNSLSVVPFNNAYGSNIKFGSQNLGFGIVNASNAAGNPSLDGRLIWGNDDKGFMKFQFAQNSSTLLNTITLNNLGQTYMGGADFSTVTTLSSPTLYAETYAGAGNLASGSAIYGLASFGRFERIGVFGDGSLGTGNGRVRAIYGIAPSGDWAGYFNGDVFCTGSYLPSDKRLKKDIAPLESMLPLLLKLKPSSYEYDVTTSKKMQFAKGRQVGFIAQELEEILPNLLTDFIEPTNNINEEPQKFKSINYIGLIPVMVKAIQEQQVQIEELKKQLQSTKANEITVINEATDAITEKIKASSFMLAQNVPNPFTSSTTIKYGIPANNIAMIAVFDLNGKMLLQFPNLRGASQITINGSTLQAGMYLYSLLVNGQEIITKKMVLTK